MVVTVGSDDQRYGDEVVSQHLPVILATLLDVDHKDLLEPEAELSEDVELVQGAELAVWPEGPKVPEVQPRGRVIVEILQVSRVSSVHTRDAPRWTNETRMVQQTKWCTYKTKGPEDAAVYNQPGLFAESSDLFLLEQAHMLSVGSENIFHGSGAKARQCDDNQEHIVDVVEAGTVSGRSVIVILQGEELGGIGLGFWKEVVGAEQEGQEVEGEP